MAPGCARKLVPSDMVPFTETAVVASAKPGELTRMIVLPMAAAYTVKVAEVAPAGTVTVVG